MEARTVNALPPAAADHAAIRCLLAIELSKKSWSSRLIRRWRTRSAGTRCPDVIGRGFWS